jgi:hypothetical protein
VPLSKKRAHLLTPQDRHWYAQEGTLSARPVLGVLQAVSFFSKLPVLSWTAAEAANSVLLFILVVF